LIRVRRAPGAAELARIRRRMATAPFGPKQLDLEKHRAKRVSEQQWPADTINEQYLSDLRRLCSNRGALIGLFIRRGGPMAIAIHDTDRVLTGPMMVGSRRLVAAFYSVDRGMLISGYQVAELADLTLPEEILWCN
jgi:hypothetical protein